MRQLQKRIPLCERKHGISEYKAPLSSHDKAKILLWLDLKEEYDQELIDECIQRCNGDEEVRTYFLNRADAELDKETIQRGW